MILLSVILMFISLQDPALDAASITRRWPDDDDDDDDVPDLSLFSQHL